MKHQVIAIAEKTKGYTIRASLRRGPAGDDLMGQKLPKGNYYLYFKCDEDETITADIHAYIHNLEEDGVCQSEIMIGETPVISFRNAYRYYKFVPQRAGIYQAARVQPIAFHGLKINLRVKAHLIKSIKNLRAAGGS